MSAGLIPQALGLAAVGMAMVFILLSLLVAAITVMTRLVGPRRRDAEPSEILDDDDAQAEMAAAVAAAIRHHRARMAGGAQAQG
ncbi:MAG: hypothetical protein OXH52_02590 [Gammaproteobacteria bacterium]|nr:hypothetical protein [Gammaproteobacteria bacterium]